MSDGMKSWHGVIQQLSQQEAVFPAQNVAKWLRREQIMVPKHIKYYAYKDIETCAKEIEQLICKIEKAIERIRLTDETDDGRIIHRAIANIRPYAKEIAKTARRGMKAQY